MCPLENSHHAIILWKLHFVKISFAALAVSRIFLKVLCNKVTQLLGDVLGIFETSQFKVKTALATYVKMGYFLVLQSGHIAVGWKTCVKFDKCVAVVVFKTDVVAVPNWHICRRCSAHNLCSENLHFRWQWPSHQCDQMNIFLANNNKYLPNIIKKFAKVGSKFC